MISPLAPAAVEIDVSHRTSYSFSKPAFLEPHLLRFQPRADGAQTPIDVELDIHPKPTGAASWLDAAGNVVTQVWFDGLHQFLEILSRAVVRTFRQNPFDYLLDVRRTHLPVYYGAEAESLIPYLQRCKPPAGERDEIALLASRMRSVSGDELVPLLTALNNTIYERLSVVRRDDGAPWEPHRTWREGCGACRDLAVLFIDACRALGVAARFVSGYELPCGPIEPCDLHAWVEVYVPGGGWRGYDPSRGLATADNYVAVAAAASAENAAPVTGTFRGDDVESTMESEILIQRQSAAIHESMSQAACM